MAVAKRAPRTQGAKQKQLDYMKGLNALPVSLSFMGGMALGRFAVTKLSKSKTVKGLMGADTKGLIVPLLVTGTGLMAPQFFGFKDKLAIAACHGVAGAGADVTIQKLTGKSLIKTVSGLMGLDGDDFSEAIPENTMQAVSSVQTRFAQQLPEADIDIEAAIEKELNAQPVNGMVDNLIYSDDLGDAEFDPEIDGVDDIEDVDIFAGDMPK